MADSKAPIEDDLLAGLGPAPTITAGNAAAPLGPPQSFYREQALTNPALAGFQPYLQGDQWQPAYNLSTEDRDRLKYRMNQAGLYGTSGYQSGSWTGEDANAYQAVLESANGMGVRDPELVIDNIAAEVKKGPRVTGPRAPLVAQISNPDTIRAVIRDSAYSLTGSRLTDEQENHLIATYQSQQAASQQAQYAAGGTGGPGGTVTQEASAQDFANAQIEQMRPGDVASHRYIAAFDKILGSMGTMVENTPTYSGKGLPAAGQQEVL